MKKKHKIHPKTKSTRNILRSKKVKEQDFVDEKTEYEDHQDPEYLFEEKPQSPSVRKEENDI